MLSEKMFLLKKRILLAICFVLFCVVGCESSCANNSKNNKSRVNKQESSDNLAAIVNGEKIDGGKLDDLFNRAVDKFTRTGRNPSADIERRIRGSILRKMIDDEIFRQVAEAEGIKIDRFERVEALEQYKAKMGGQKAFNFFLQQQNLNESQILETILSERRREKIVEKQGKKISVSDKEIESHYNANKKLYRLPEMVRARHILVKLSKSDPKEKSALALKKAQQILAEAKDPKNSFESLVHKYSEGPSVAKGGDLGFFPRGRMVKPFEDAAFSARLKTPVGPIKTDFGYHIIYVEEKLPSRTSPLANVRKRIEEFMSRNKRSQAAEKMLSTLRLKANVKINDYSMTQEEYKNLAKNEHAVANTGLQEKKKK